MYLVFFIVFQDIIGNNIIEEINTLVYLHGLLHFIPELKDINMSKLIKISGIINRILKPSILKIPCSRVFLIYLFLRFAGVICGRFIAVRVGFNLSTYVQNRW